MGRYFLDSEEIKKRFESEKIVSYEGGIESFFRFITINKTGEKRDEMIIVPRNEDFLFKIDSENCKLEKFSDEDLKQIVSFSPVGIAYYFEEQKKYLFCTKDYSHFTICYKNRGEKDIFIIKFDDRVDYLLSDVAVLGFSIFNSFLYILTQTEIKKIGLSIFWDKVLTAMVERVEDPFFYKNYINLSAVFSDSESFKLKNPMMDEIVSYFVFHKHKDKFYFSRYYPFYAMKMNLTETLEFSMSSETLNYLYFPILSHNIGSLVSMFNNTPEEFFKLFRITVGIGIEFLPFVYADEKCIVYVERKENSSEKMKIIVWKFKDYDVALKEDVPRSYSLLRDYKIPQKKEVAKKHILDFLLNFNSDNTDELKFVYENYREIIWAIISELSGVERRFRDFRALLKNLTYILTENASKESLKRLLDFIGYDFEQKWICKNCGEENSVTAFMCEKCQTSLFDKYKEKYEKGIIDFTLEKIPYAFIYFNTLVKNRSYSERGNDFDINNELNPTGSIENEKFHFPLFFNSLIYTVKKLNSPDLSIKERNLLRAYAEMFFPVLFKILGKSEKTLDMAHWLLLNLKDDFVLDIYVKDIGNYKLVELKDYIIEKLNDKKFLENVLYTLKELKDKSSENLNKLRFYLRNETDYFVRSDIIDFLEEFEDIPDFKQLIYLFSISNYNVKKIIENEFSIISELFREILYIYDEDSEAVEKIRNIRKRISDDKITGVFIFFYINLALSEREEVEERKNFWKLIRKYFFSEKEIYKKYIREDYIRNLTNRKKRVKIILDFLNDFYGESIDFEYKFIIAVAFSLVKGIVPYATKDKIGLNKIILLLSEILERGYNQYRDFRKVLAAICLVELGVDKKWENITLDLLEKNNWDDWFRVFDLGVNVLSYLENWETSKYMVLMSGHYTKISVEQQVKIKNYLFEMAKKTPQKAIEIYEKYNIGFDGFEEAKLYAFAGIKKNYDYVLKHTYEMRVIEGLEVISMVGDDEESLKVLEKAKKTGAPEKIVKEGIKNVKMRLARKNKLKRKKQVKNDKS